MGAKTIKQVSRSLKWKADLPQLFEEVMNNPGTSMLKMPLHLTKSILEEVAARAIELNDPILNELMCDLRLYDIPEPASKEYTKLMTKVRKAAEEKRLEEMDPGVIKAKLLREIKSGKHEQFVLDKVEEIVKCRCGHAAVFLQNGYICGTITAYPCKFNK